MAKSAGRTIGTAGFSTFPAVIKGLAFVVQREGDTFLAANSQLRTKTRELEKVELEVCGEAPNRPFHAVLAVSRVRTRRVEVATSMLPDVAGKDFPSPPEMIGHDLN